MRHDGWAAIKTAALGHCNQLLEVELGHELRRAQHGHDNPTDFPQVRDRQPWSQQLMQVGFQFRE